MVEMTRLVGVRSHMRAYLCVHGYLSPAVIASIFEEDAHIDHQSMAIDGSGPNNSIVSIVLILFISLILRLHCSIPVEVVAQRCQIQCIRPGGVCGLGLVKRRLGGEHDLVSPWFRVSVTPR